MTKCQASPMGGTVGRTFWTLCFFLVIFLGEQLGRHQKKKRNCRNHLTPPPSPHPSITQIRATRSSFFRHQNSRFNKEKVYKNVGCGGGGVYEQTQKTVQSSKHWHSGRNRLILLTKNTLLKQRQTNSGIGRNPPPS